MNNIKLTHESLHAIGTSNGVDWNRKQLEILGVSFPPKKGWLKKLIGTEITDVQYQNLIMMRNVKQNQSKAKETAKERKLEPMSQAEQGALLKRLDKKIAKWKEAEYKKRRDELLNKNKQQSNHSKYQPKQYAGPIHRGKDWYAR
jgi:hypothetical protein